MTDAERLEALRKFHATWGDTPAEDINPQTIWEAMGLILGTLRAAGPVALAVVK